jgi:hypothetical protein
MLHSRRFGPACRQADPFAVEPSKTIAGPMLGWPTGRFTLLEGSDTVSDMNQIKAILEADADGTLHLPVPPELRRGRIEVTATLKPAAESRAQPRFGCLSGKIRLAPDFDEPLDDLREYMQ